jgi:phosphoglycolate phosphatase-like HAD superfamily hydrolase
MQELVGALVDAFSNRLNGDERRRREQVMDLLHLPPRQMIQAMVDLVGLHPSQYRTIFEPVAARLPTRLFPEVPAVLASLKQLGHLVVISSNNPDDTIRDRLAGVGLMDQYEFALGTIYDEGITKQDHPRLAAERLGMLPEELAAAGVFVGDLPGDMELARKAGLLAIGRLTGANADSLIAAGAEHVITDLTELEPLLNSVNATT